MPNKPLVTTKILENIAAAFDNALKRSLAGVLNDRENLSEGAYYREFAASASRFFRQELGLEERTPGDYRGNEPKPRTQTALLKLLKERGVETGIDRSLATYGGPRGGFVGENALEDAICIARQEATRQIEQANAAPKKRPFRSPEEVAARKADAFAVRVNKKRGELGKVQEARKR
jgi:hypothetical protein